MCVLLCLMDQACEHHEHICMTSAQYRRYVKTCRAVAAQVALPGQARHAAAVPPGAHDAGHLCAKAIRLLRSSTGYPSLSPVCEGDHVSCTLYRAALERRNLCCHSFASLQEAPADSARKRSRDRTAHQAQHGDACRRDELAKGPPQRRTLQQAERDSARLKTRRRGDRQCGHRGKTGIPSQAGKNGARCSTHLTSRLIT